MTVVQWPHYEIQRLETLEDLWGCFPDDKADEMNWLVLSTSGVHGSCATLDGLLEKWDDQEYVNAITVLVIQPRLVVLRYGELELHDHEGVERLRRIVTSSVSAIIKSQQENIEPA